MAEDSTATAPHLRLVPESAAPPFPLQGEAAAGFLRSVLDSSPDCIKIIELDGTLSYMNSNGCHVMEVDDFCAINGKPWHELWPSSTKGEILDSVKAAREGKKSRFEAFCPTAKGTPRWWDVSVSPIMSDTGDITAIVSISRDVTDRVHRENQIRLHELELQNLTIDQAETLREKQREVDSKEVMLREVDHRMKNSLAMLTALLRSESRKTSSGEAREKISAAAGRVASIASVHEQLYLNAGQNSADGKRHLAMETYLASLCRDLANTMDSEQIDLVVDSDPVALDSGDAVTLGMLVSELVMNAARHGADEEQGCRIEVSLKRQEGDQLSLIVSDNGSGLPDDFAPERSTGLGMRVVTSSAVKLDGKLTFGNGRKGSYFRLDFKP